MTNSRFPGVRGLSRLREALGVAGILATASCGTTSQSPAALASDGGADAPGTFDDPHIEAASISYKGFAKMNRNAYKTQQHAGNTLVNIYANSIAEERYRSIDPNGNAPAGFEFPPGAIIVKEMLKREWRRRRTHCDVQEGARVRPDARRLVVRAPES